MKKRGWVFLLFLTLCTAGSLWGDHAPVIPDTFAGHFRGEMCSRCHSSMPGYKPQAPTEEAEVVIVGGGMSGLVSLFSLGDVNAVLLETQDRVGGQMLKYSWNGVEYAEGAAYVPEPFGAVRSFLEAAEVPLKKVAAPDNSAWIRGKYYADCWIKGKTRMPWKGKDKENYLAFLKKIEELGEDGAVNQPVENFSREGRDLDRITARKWMKDYGLNDEMIELFDRYLRSCYGEDSQSVSAAAMANFMTGEVTHAFTLPGGLGGVTQHLYGKLKDRVRLKSHVLRVEQDTREARVTYLDAHMNQHTIRAKGVIMAVPGKLLPTLIPDLPEEKKSIIAKTKYAGYLVATVLCKEPIWDDKGYDTWILGTFFCDIIDADWITRDGKPHADRKGPHILSLYTPLGYGKQMDLFQFDPAGLKKKILTDLEKVIPGCSSKIEDIWYQRFGHSMQVPVPGFMTEVVPVLRKPYFRISFAGVETEGLACIESAILSGIRAAREIRTWLWPDLPTPEHQAYLDLLKKRLLAETTPH